VTPFSDPVFDPFFGLLLASGIATISQLFDVHHMRRFKVRMQCSERDFLRI